VLNPDRVAPFADFVRAVYPRLVSRIGARLGDGAAAEDVVQEALARAWERTLSGAVIESLPAWITTAALNLSRDRWRRQRAEERALLRLAVAEPGLLEGVVPPEPDTIPSDLAAHVAALPRRQREVVLLHYFADMSVGTVAAALGVNEGTVKQCLFRARQRLQRAIAPLAPTTGASEVASTDPRSNSAEWRARMKGWHKAGSQPGDYEYGIADEQLDGQRTAFLRSTAAEPTGFGTVMQMIAADRYCGKRIRFCAQLRTTAVDGLDDWAGLWMRVDGPDGRRSLAFDNMQTSKREVRGTTGWHRYEVVLDAPPESRAIGFGVLLSGRGDVRVGSLQLEEVGPDVSTTNAPPRELPQAPQNLDFSED
jgi:RNA polymerase sigma factor (sigma-70 family)